MPNENDSFKYLDGLRKPDYLKPLIGLIKLDGCDQIQSSDADELPVDEDPEDPNEPNP